MCQSKSQGGRRCAGKGKGSSFFPAGLEENLASHEYICPRCGQSGSRSSVHSCQAKDLLPLSSFQEKVNEILRSSGYTPLIIGEDVRNAVQAQLNGEPEPSPAFLYVNDDAPAVAKTLKDAGVNATAKNDFVTIEKDGNTVNVRTWLQDSPFTIDKLTYNPETGVINDPEGGLADIRDGVIRHTEAFEDNPVSVLRGAVLAAQTGYSVAPETRDAASDASHLYESIPKAEVWKQWEDLSLSKEPSKALTAIHEMGWEKNFPELAAIRGVPQSTFWHPEGPVEVHTGQAADIAARKADEDGLSAEDRSVVVLAAISHDLGKSESTVIDEDGKISSAGHEYTGHKLSKKFLRGIGASAAVKRQVPLIVYSHMCHAQPPTEKAVRRLMKKLDNEGNGTTIEMWARVAEADKAGRGVAGTFGVREEFLEVAEKIRIKDAKPAKTFIDGKFLTGLGYKPGEQYRDMLHAAKEAYENGEASNEAQLGEWMKRNFPL